MIGSTETKYDIIHGAAEVTNLSSKASYERFKKKWKI